MRHGLPRCQHREHHRNAGHERRSAASRRTPSTFDPVGRPARRACCARAWRPNAKPTAEHAQSGPARPTVRSRPTSAASLSELRGLRRCAACPAPAGTTRSSSPTGRTTLSTERMASIGATSRHSGLSSVSHGRRRDGAEPDGQRERRRARAGRSTGGAPPGGEALHVRERREEDVADLLADLHGRDVGDVVREVVRAHDVGAEEAGDDRVVDPARREAGRVPDRHRETESDHRAEGRHRQAGWREPRYAGHARAHRGKTHRAASHVRHDDRHAAGAERGERDGHDRVGELAGRPADRPRRGSACRAPGRARACTRFDRAGPTGRGPAGSARWSAPSSRPRAECPRTSTAASATRPEREVRHGRRARRRPFVERSPRDVVLADSERGELVRENDGDRRVGDLDRARHARRST